MKSRHARDLESSGKLSMQRLFTICWKDSMDSGFDFGTELWKDVDIDDCFLLSSEPMES